MSDEFTVLGLTVPEIAKLRDEYAKSGQSFSALRDWATAEADKILAFAKIEKQQALIDEMTRRLKQTVE